MANIIDYIKWRGDIPFSQVPLGEVDALLLSYLSYMLYEGIVEESPRGEGVRIADASHALLLRAERERSSLSYSLRDDGKLLALLEGSARFGQTRLVGYVSRMNRTEEQQFSAVTYLLDDGTAFAAFRGTDDSVVGWKEDFNMSFEDAVPSQRDAVLYIQDVCRTLDRPLYIGGHSKGGNLAAYAGIFADEDTRSRVLAVYNFDGPGFNESVIASPAFGRMDTRVHTFVPQSSMIGILLWHHEPFTIVRSDSVGVFQHNAYSWQVMGGHFVTLSARTSNSHFADDIVKRWLKGLTPELRRRMIDGIYAVLCAADGQSVGDLLEGKNLLAILRAAGSIDEPTRAALDEAMRQLGASMRDSVPDWIDRTASDIRLRMAGERRVLGDAPAGSEPDGDALGGAAVAPQEQTAQESDTP